VRTVEWSYHERDDPKEETALARLWTKTPWPLQDSKKMLAVSAMQGHFPDPDPQILFLDNFGFD